MTTAQIPRALGNDQSDEHRGPSRFRESIAATHMNGHPIQPHPFATLAGAAASRPGATPRIDQPGGLRPTPFRPHPPSLPACLPQTPRAIRGPSRWSSPSRPAQGASRAVKRPREARSVLIPPRCPNTPLNPAFQTRGRCEGRCRRHRRSRTDDVRRGCASQAPRAATGKTPRRRCRSSLVRAVGISAAAKAGHDQP